MKSETVEKLNKFVIDGYTPSRKDESYKKIHPILKTSYGSLVNCVEHAFFNLKNNQILTGRFNTFDADALANFSHKNDKSIDDVRDRILNFVSSTGIIIKKWGPHKILKNNEWIVALYYDRKYRDIHFLLKGNLFWTGKRGFSNYVDTYGYLPKYIKAGYDYFLQDIYVVENPFAKQTQITSKIEDVVSTKQTFSERKSGLSSTTLKKSELSL